MKKILVVVCMVLFLVSFVSVECATADRFVKNNDGTVTDTQERLMWADHDSASEMTWSQAKNYCEGYSGGGKSGWRMPTQNELAQLYGNNWRSLPWKTEDDRALLFSSGDYRSVITINGPYLWASETRGSEAAVFSVVVGGSGWASQSKSYHLRALPVRSGN